MSVAQANGVVEILTCIYSIIALNTTKIDEYYSEFSELGKYLHCSPIIHNSTAQMFQNLDNLSHNIYTIERIHVAEIYWRL